MSKWKTVAQDIITNTAARVLSAALVATGLAIWGLIKSIDPFLVAIGGIWVLVGILFLMKLIFDFLDRTKAKEASPPPKPNSQSELTIQQEGANVSPALSSVEVSERSAFLRQLQVVASRLARNTQGAHDDSTYGIYRGILGTSQFRGLIRGQTERLLAFRLLALDVQQLGDACGAFSAKVEGLVITDLDAGRVQRLCNKIRGLTNEYRRLVDELIVTIDWFDQELEAGVSLDSFDWARTFGGFVENFNELMRNLRDLHRDAPKETRSLLPGDEQLRDFVRHAARNYDVRLS